MAIFNSLGSNYQPKHIAQMLIGFDGLARDKLEAYLAERYNGQVELTYKGREALYLALTDLEVPEGSHVAVNGYTCYAVYDSVTAAGLVPLYIDVDKRGLNFSRRSLEKAHKQNPDLKVVIIQNTLGFPADMAGIEEYCQQHDLHLIEDLAHSVGMHYVDGREAGTVSTAALSFSQDKVVDAVSGGALVYRGDKREHTLGKVKYGRFLKDYYYIWNTLFIRSGYRLGGRLWNYIMRKLHFLPRPMDGDANNVRRPENWHASMALRQFKDLKRGLQHRRQIVEVYEQNLPQKIKFASDDNATYLRYPLFVDDPASLKAHLAQANIHISDTWYDAPISPERCLVDTDYKAGTCPNAEELAAHMINLPTHVNVDVTDAERITEKVNEWLSSREQ